MMKSYLEKAALLVASAATGNPEDVRKCLADGANIHHENDLPLRAAAIMGNFENVKFLVEKGADVKAAHSEALLYAAKRGDHEIVAFLIAQGASIADVLQHHKADVDPECRKSLELPQSQKLRTEFEQNHRQLKDKLKTRKRPYFKRDV